MSGCQNACVVALIELQVRTGSEQVPVRTDSEQVLQKWNIYWWVGDEYICATFVNGIKLEWSTIKDEWLPGMDDCQNATSLSHSLASWIVSTQK